VALKKMFQRFTAPVSELDREALRNFCSTIPDIVNVSEAKARDDIVVAGEIRSVRIVPKPDGSPWLEATISDGTGALTAMWTGRKKIAGIRPGQRLVVKGRGSPTGPGGRLVLLNPRYELI
jgi:hypothetical protein